MLMESPKSVARRTVVVKADHAVSCGGLGPRARFSDVRARYEPCRSDVQKRSSIVCADHESDRASVIGSALQQRGYTVEVAADRQAALERILADPPDLLLYDASTLHLNGIGACLDLLHRLSESADRRTAVQFVVVMGESQGGSEFTADGDARTLGVASLSASADRPRDKDQGPQASPIGLTDREKEVLTWAARGKTSADIATILGLKERTVNFHCDNAMKRLDVINRTQAVAKAVAEGLIGI